MAAILSERVGRILYGVIPKLDKWKRSLGIRKYPTDSPRRFVVASPFQRLKARTYYLLA
jgi:hypothetical protein